MKKFGYKMDSWSIIRRRKLIVRLDEPRSNKLTEEVLSLKIQDKNSGTICGRFWVDRC